jgi:nicotinamidase-related amidase
MNPRTTALLLIEYQNDFTSAGGKLHEAVKPVMESTHMLENTVEMVNEARKAGATIVYVPITFAPDFREIGPSPYGILKGCKDGQAFQKGSWGAEIVDALKPQPDDIVVEGKRGLDGFASTNLDFILRNRKIDTIALGGFLTNCCVESTMRTGYELGYNVITIKDCAATVSEEAHRGALEHDFPMFSHPMNHDEFVSALGQGTE